MKKISFALTCLFLLSFLAGCCSHEWADATCENPSICNKCEVTEGEALGHNFIEGICENSCSRCGKTTGESSHTTGFGECEKCKKNVTDLAEEAKTIINYCTLGIDCFNKAYSAAEICGREYNNFSEMQKSTSYMNQAFDYFRYATREANKHPTEFKSVVDSISKINDRFREMQDLSFDSPLLYSMTFNVLFTMIDDDMKEIISFGEYAFELIE